jgi:hypothetical protein
MKLLLQVVAILVATVVVSIAVSVWTAPALPDFKDWPTIEPGVKKKLATTGALVTILFDHPPKVLRACDLLDDPSNVPPRSHADLVRAAKCLQRHHVITTQDLARVKKATWLKFDGSSEPQPLQTISVEISWWTLLPFAAGLGLCLLLVYRNMQRHPPGF